jgi:hypothetical protein
MGGARPEVIDDFKKTFPNARVGRKNLITRRWARRGTRPRAPLDQRTQWAFARRSDRVWMAPAGQGLFG